MGFSIYMVYLLPHYVVVKVHLSVRSDGLLHGLALLLGKVQVDVH